MSGRQSGTVRNKDAQSRFFCQKYVSSTLMLIPTANLSKCYNDLTRKGCGTGVVCGVTADLPRPPLHHLQIFFILRTL